MTWAQPDAAVGDWVAQMAYIIGSVNGVSGVKEDRIRHGRVVVELGIMHPLERIRCVGAGRGTIPSSCRRYRPIGKLSAVNRHFHRLT